jgi:hypothetical protein
MEDSITIDNFKTKLAKLDAGTKPLFGLVDMGRYSAYSRLSRYNNLT